MSDQLLAPDIDLPCAETCYDLPDKAPAERCVFLGWNKPGVAPFVPVSTAIGESIAVSMNHGRWIAECPSCRGAQFASRTDPRFFCVDCLNAWCGSQWVTLTWPDEPQAIEAAVEVREVANRNWTPDETVADLMQQNDEHMSAA